MSARKATEATPVTEPEGAAPVTDEAPGDFFEPEAVTDEAPEAPTEAPARPVRYAVYDTAYERFVGGVYDTAEAANAATDRGARGIVREV